MNVGIALVVIGAMVCAIVPLVVISSLWWAWAAHIILGWYAPILGISAPSFIKVLAARMCLAVLVPHGSSSKNKDEAWWQPLVVVLISPPIIVALAWAVYKVAL